MKDVLVVLEIRKERTKRNELRKKSPSHHHIFWLESWVNVLISCWLIIIVVEIMGHPLLLTVHMALQDYHYTQCLFILATLLLHHPGSWNTLSVKTDLQIPQ
jgi:hypothetical protein